MTTSITAHIGREHYKTTISNNRNELTADEPAKDGGTDLGFTPEELLCSSLASCTSITLRMYADRKEWDLQSVTVSVNLEGNTSIGTTTIFRTIKCSGNLTDVQLARLFQIANQCPVHKMLSNNIQIQTTAI